MKKKTEEALGFFNSMRGRYIISQALSIAIEEMEKVKSPHKEVSNISDMKYLQDELFPIYKAIEAMHKKIKRGIK